MFCLPNRPPKFIFPSIYPNRLATYPAYLSLYPFLHPFPPGTPLYLIPQIWQLDLSLSLWSICLCAQEEPEPL